MEMRPLDSSNIKAVGYDPHTKRMQVQFGCPSTPDHQCSIYEYKNVTPAQHAALMKAESHGKHFAKTFKNPKRHPVTKLEK